MRFSDIEYSQAVAEKLWSKHRVEVEEVKQVLNAEVGARRTRDGLYQVMGRSEAGRYLMVIVRDLGGGRGRLITARDMDQQERRRYRVR